MDNVSIINKKLVALYGKSIDGKPNFRLVWSEGLTEKRVGPVYSSGGILISEKELQECKKYSYIKERWILENYNTSYRANPEVAVSDGYEAIFVFDRKGKYLKPNLLACQYIVDAIRSPERVHKTERMFANEKEEKKQKEIAEYFDFLVQEGSDFGQKFTEGSGVILPGKDFQ
jgi:hypothetical protein